MVKKLFMGLLLAGMSAAGRAGNGETFGYAGIMRAQGTFSLGHNTAFSSVNYFVHGNIEYYAEPRWSVRGDGYYFLNSRTAADPVEPFAYQHNLLAGVQYHFLQGRVDWYAGLQPGMVFGQRQYAQIEALEGSPNPLPVPQKTVAPVFSVNTGINYYANRIVHLFAEARYNAGWFSDNYSVASLSELRFSFGLGFFIRVKNR